MKIEIKEIEGKKALCVIGGMTIWLDLAMLKQYGIKKPIAGKTYGED